MRHVEIILKVAERCNLNCTYCYFFNKENRDFENHPALISVDTVRHLVRFLRTSFQRISETIFQIDIHGGEPLLLGPTRFSEIVSIIKHGLSDAKAVRFSVQTNAVLINQAWINVFSQYQIYVGISIDGPKAQHDANRIDRHGRGTFDRLISKVDAVKQASEKGYLPGFGSISVVSPESDARSVYKCLAHELGFSRLQFLFPDDTHESMNAINIGRFVAFAEDLFECWENDERGCVRIQLIDSTLQGILQREDRTRDYRASSAVDNVVLTVSSAGDIGHDDTLRNVVPHLFNSGMNVADTTFPEFLAWHTGVSKALALRQVVPDCASCAWFNICEHVTRGETPLHRMRNGIADQPSIYCEALKATYLKGATYLAKRGVPIYQISQRLITTNSLPSL